MMLDTESSFSMAANRTFLTSCASSAPPHLGQSDYDYSGLPCPRVFGPDADQNADQLQRTKRSECYQKALDITGKHQKLRLFPWHCRGHRFETSRAHHRYVSSLGRRQTFSASSIARSSDQAAPSAASFSISVSVKCSRSAAMSFS
jgi:hypothetical protein